MFIIFNHLYLENSEKTLHHPSHLSDFQILYHNQGKQQFCYSLTLSKTPERCDITWQRRHLASWTVTQSFSAILGHLSSAYRSRLSDRRFNEAGNLKECPTLYWQSLAITFLCVLRNVGRLSHKSEILKDCSLLFWQS